MMKTLYVLPLLATVSLYTASVANAQDGLITNGRNINGRTVNGIDLNGRNINGGILNGHTSTSAVDEAGSIKVVTVILQDGERILLK